MGTYKTDPAARPDVLEAEYEHEPVPRGARKGLAEFGANETTAVIETFLRGVR